MGSALYGSMNNEKKEKNKMKTITQIIAESKVEILREGNKLHFGIANCWDDKISNLYRELIKFEKVWTKEVKLGHCYYETTIAVKDGEEMYEIVSTADSSD